MSDRNSKVGVSSSYLLGLVLVGLGIFLIVARFSPSLWPKKESPEQKQRIFQLVQSEELILGLTPRLKQLGASVRNLDFPNSSSGCEGLFESELSYNELAPRDQIEHLGEASNLGITWHRWPHLEEIRKTPTKEVSLWPELIDDAEYFERAKFYLVKGEFSNSSRNQFQSQMGFSGLAKMNSGKWRSINAKLKAIWTSPDPSPTANSEWKISKLAIKELKFKESSDLLFEETLDHAIRDPKQLFLARNGFHNEYILQAVTTGRIHLPVEFYRKHFSITADGRHPAISVADVNGDGWDDLYVMIRWGKNQLLQNRGDGTFFDNASAVGLDLDGVSAGGIFADFDNDGDQDLMLGRTLKRSALLINENGKFYDRTDELISAPLPYLVTTVSAADYNGDGLLDVYLSTYGFPHSGKEGAQNWGPEMLASEDSKELLRRFDDPEIGYNRFINSIGPPNVLLVNRGGGKFEISPENEKLQLFLNTFQSTWADFDNDGDPDLYVSNDFAPDALFRNDDGSFVEITNEAGGPTMAGFGMGATWGDYDNDGLQDLYISNMYSKAGMRITEQVPGIDKRFRMSADGNRLYKNAGEKFELVSANQQEGFGVVKAGWSWGGQFFDVDNDTELDIYVTSGYRTAPAEIATDIDL